MEPNPQDEPLCSSCGLHPAHTFLTEIINGEMTNRSFCDECASQLKLNTDDDGISIHDAKCYYCGGKTAGGAMNDYWEKPIRMLSMHYTCFRCMDLYRQSLLEFIDRIPKDLSPENQLQYMNTMVAEVDALVKSKVS